MAEFWKKTARDCPHRNPFWRCHERWRREFNARSRSHWRNIYHVDIKQVKVVSIQCSSQQPRTKVTVCSRRVVDEWKVAYRTVWIIGDVIWTLQFSGSIMNSLFQDIIRKGEIIIDLDNKTHKSIVKDMFNSEWQQISLKFNHQFIT